MEFELSSHSFTKEAGAYANDTVSQQKT
ncbi:protein of unknown function [Ralstonia solanacearum CMR15]|nr:protein of unknown function [Ralstonia solanacearum CMR15]